MSSHSQRNGDTPCLLLLAWEEEGTRYNSLGTVSLCRVCNHHLAVPLFLPNSQESFPRKHFLWRQWRNSGVPGVELQSIYGTHLTCSPWHGRKEELDTIPRECWPAAVRPSCTGTSCGSGRGTPPPWLSLSRLSRISTLRL